MRKGAARGLRWLDVDLDDPPAHPVARSFASTPKGEGQPQSHLRMNPRTVPVLSRRLAPELSTHPEGSGISDNRPATPGPPAAALLGFPGRLHARPAADPCAAPGAVRHGFASRCVMSGGGLLALQRVSLGRRNDVICTARYETLQRDGETAKVLGPSIRQSQVHTLRCPNPRPAKTEACRWVGSQKPTRVGSQWETTVNPPSRLPRYLPKGRRGPEGREQTSGSIPRNNSSTAFKSRP
jgi:hypothetical protein